MSIESISQLLPKLSTQELSDLKRCIDQEIQSRLRTLGVNGELTEEEAACVRNHDLIRCVKLIRERTGLGLRDSKHYMDRAREQLVQMDKQPKVPYFVIYYHLSPKSYYCQMTNFGPAFGATREQSPRFNSHGEAAAVIARFPIVASTCCEVEAVE